MTTVLVRFGQLGDVVLLGAVTSALGDAVIVTEPRWHGVTARLAGVRQVLAPDEARGTRGRWVDLQGSLRSAWICRGTGATRIHKRSVVRRLWVRTGWPSPPRPPVTAIYAEAVGVRPAEPPWIHVARAPDALVVLPGAAWPLKRWSGFPALARAWDGPVVVVGGPGEEGLCASVAAGLPDASVVCGPGWDGVFEALARAVVAVGNDSGLLHLAAACGVPTVGLFGPTHPADGFAAHLDRVVQREDVRCRPCALHRVRRCARGDHACLQIAVEPVLDAAATSMR